MKKGLFLSASLLCMGIVASCTQKMVTKENDLSFATFNEERTVHLFNDTTAPKCELNFNIEYPEKSSDALLLKGVQELFVVSVFGEQYETYAPAEAIRKYQADYIADYLLLEKDYSKEEGANNWMNYQQWIESEPVLNENGFLTYVASFYTYTGGAHGMSEKQYQVIDLSGPYMLTLGDIFDESDHHKLSELLIEQLMKKQGCSTRAQLEELGYDLGAIVPTENFGMLREGILWQYNPYEIAPYAVGLTDISLPYAQLLPYIKSDSPVLSYAESHDNNQK